MKQKRQTIEKINGTNAAFLKRFNKIEKSLV